MNNAELLSMVMFLLAFVATGAAGFFFFLRAFGDEKRVLDRLRNLSDNENTEDGDGSLKHKTLGALPKLGSLLLPSKKTDLAKLKAKLDQAGLFSPLTLKVYLGAKFVLLVSLPIFLAAVPYALGLLSPRNALVAGSVAAALGLLGPSFWLNNRIRKRQHAMRRAMPDALDMLVLCMESGLSLPAAFQRVSEELVGVHPALGQEWEIIQQTTQLGLSTGEAFERFAERSGLDEAKELASVLIQAERFGASVVRALKQHADHYRETRQQRAEETAQKASVKILFPLLLFIFPAVFVVLVGPAAFQVAKMFSN